MIDVILFPRPGSSFPMYLRHYSLTLYFTFEHQTNNKVRRDSHLIRVLPMNYLRRLFYFIFVKRIWTMSRKLKSSDGRFK